MEKDQRNNLRRVINQCRRLLEEEITRRLAYYGVQPEESFVEPWKLQHLAAADLEVRRRLEQAVEKEMVGGLSKKDAVVRYVRHVAFTYLNRLAALRAMEVRGLLKETIVRRSEYGGRSLRERDIAELQPELTPDQVVRESLLQAFREVGDEIKVLFDVNDAYSLVFPADRACRELVRLLTEEVTEQDWREDDVIGWIYQYFNSQARREYREARRKPTADDIPVINQFYTPDWIVKALTDNTLGRLWLEMHPKSKVQGLCTYLVPLREGLDKREPKRVRDIKVLDPACGSGHFLVYAFDVLYSMYLEDEPETPPSEIPGLILENNLFGIDIDLRAVQLAALSLYLKAKTYSRDLKVRGMNLVCADSRIMDGERKLDFLRRFEDDLALQRIFARLLEDLDYTFEIGSLLKVRAPFEDLFRRRVSGGEEGRVGVSIAPKGQAEFRGKGLASQARFVIQQPKEPLRREVVITVPRERTVEEMLEELRVFEREAFEAQDMGRLLFAAEVEKSVGLLAILSNRYDVVLMNPPYGDAPESVKEYLSTNYPRTHYDYYAAFIEQAVDLCEPNGFVGMLTGRTFMFLKWFEKVRTEILYYDARPEIVLDLNSAPADNILDEATARWAATVTRKAPAETGRSECLFLRLTVYEGEEEKIKRLGLALEALREGGKHEAIYPTSLETLKKLPRMPYSYWVPESLAALFEKYPPLDRDNAERPDQPKIADLRVGLQTGDDDRFTRYWWEVNPESIASSRAETFQGRKWVPYVKGGDAYYSDIPFVVNWENDGEEIKNFPKSVVRNEDYYFKPGLCWSRIASSIWLDMRPLPRGSIFSVAALAAFTRGECSWGVTAAANSSLASFLFLVLNPTQHDRHLGYTAEIPVPMNAISSENLQGSCQEIHDLKRAWQGGNEVSTQFLRPWILQLVSHAHGEKPRTEHPLARDFTQLEWEKFHGVRVSPGMPIRELAQLAVQREMLLKKRLYELQNLIDRKAYDAYDISESDREIIEKELRTLRGFPKALKKNYDEAIKPDVSIEEHVARLLSYYVKLTAEEDADGIVPVGQMVQGVRKHLAADFREARSEQVEFEIAEILGKSLEEWLTQDFFDFHIGLYERRPVIWQLTSANLSAKRASMGVFNCFLHYHKLTRDTIPKVQGHMLQPIEERLARARDRVFKELQAARASLDQKNVSRLSKAYEEVLNEIEELEKFNEALNTLHNPRKDKTRLPPNAKWVDKAIAEVRDNGWNPNIDYGVRVNIEPLKELKLLHPAADRVK